MSRNKLAVLVVVIGFLALVLTGMIQIPGMPNMRSVVAGIPVIGGLLNGQGSGPGGLGNSGGGNPLIDFLKSRWGLLLVIAGLLAAFKSRIPVLRSLGSWPLVIALLLIAWIVTGLIPGMGGMNPLDVISGLFAQLMGKIQGLLPGQGGGKLPSFQGPSGPGISFKSVDGVLGLIKQYWWVLLLIGILFFLTRRGTIGGKMALILLVIGLVGGMMFLGGGFNVNLGGLKLGGQSTGQQGNCRAYHTVQPDETLFRIGLRYKLSWTVICNANGLANPNQIYVGQTLCIP